MTTPVSGGGSDLSSILNALNASSGSSAGSGAGSTNTGGGSISVPGLGTNLDVNSIVSALVGAKKAPAQNQINNKTTLATAQLNGLASLNTALTALEKALSALTDPATYNSFAATLSDTDIGTTTTLTSAQPGSYSVDVTQLAAAQKRPSGVIDPKAPVGAGTLNITVGSKSMQITVSATDTLADVATAINKATGNPGVSATVVNGAGGSQLLLTSSKTGTVNGFSVSSGSGSSSSLAGLATTLNTPGASEAQNAELTIDNIAVESATNTVSGALDGVTLNLAATGKTELDVTQDTSKISDAVGDFVTAYNGYADTVDGLDSYNQSTGQTGNLFGDATLDSVKRQVNSLMSSSVAGNAIGTLAKLGITRGVGSDQSTDGELTLNQDTLNGFLASDPTSVQGLFAGTGGYATKLLATSEGFTNSGGIIATRSTSLKSTLSHLSDQQTQLNARMAAYTTQLDNQYTALGTMMTSLNATSSYLTSALESLTNSQKN
jgi:flagellar hook-associated protein 2